MLRRLLLAVSTCVSMPVLAQAVPDWSYHPGFFSPGRDGIAIVDLAGNGTRGAVVTGSSQDGFHYNGTVFLAVLSADDASFGITRLRALPEGDAFTSTIRTFRDDAHEGDLVAAVVGRNDRFDPASRFMAFGGPALEPVLSYPLPDRFRMTGLFDVDSDGRLEIVGLRGEDPPYETIGQPMVLDLATGAVEWTDASMRVQSVGAGEVGTGQRVLALSVVDGPGLVLDGATRAQLWSWPDGFDGQVVFGDFAAPAGVREFAVVPAFGNAALFRASPTYTPLAVADNASAATVQVLDFDADGYDELVTGEVLAGRITAHSFAQDTATTLLENDESGISALAIGDLDGIAGQELVFGAGLMSTARDVLGVADVQTADVLYFRIDEHGPHSAVALFDAPGGGRELAFATAGSDSSYGGPNLAVLDADAGSALRRRDQVQDGFIGLGLRMLAAQFDGDAQQELLLGSGWGYTAGLRLVDADTLQDQWSNEDLGWGSVEAVATVGEGVPPTVAVAVRGSGNDVDGTSLVLIDGLDGSELWRSIAVSPTDTATLALRDAKASSPTLAAMSVGTRVYVFDIDKRTVQHVVQSGRVVIGQRYEGEGSACRHVLVSAEAIEERDCTTGELLDTRLLPFVATWVAMMDDARGLVLASDGSAVHLLQGGQVIRSTAAFDTRLGYGNKGAFERDGAMVRVYIGGDLGVHRITLELPLFADGFE